MVKSRPTIRLVLKYVERYGIIGGYLGENFFGEGRTKDIKARVEHI